MLRSGWRSTIVVVMMLSASILGGLVTEDAECKVGASDGYEDQEDCENLFKFR